MKGPVDWRRLARHFAGETSPEEERALNAWIKADPSRRLWTERMRRVWELAETPRGLREPSAETDEDWACLSEKMAEPAAGARQGPGKKKRLRERVSASRPRAEDRRPWGRRRSARMQAPRHVLRGETSWLKRGLGGLLLVLLVVGAVAFGALVGEEAGSGGASSFREVTTAPGERAKIRMTDGTEVTLNVDSRLRLPRTPDDAARRVFLQGEAFFDVASGERPFVVHVKEAAVNVHGTAFDVRSYAEETQVQVAVAEGTVSLHPEQERASGTRLRSGQLGRLDGENSLVVTQEVDVESYLGWTEGQIVFDDAPLPTVARRLARWYGLSFEIEDDALRTLRLTARLNSSSLRNVMDVISTTLGIHYEIQEARVVLEAAGARSQSRGARKMNALPQRGSPE